MAVRGWVQMLFGSLYGAYSLVVKLRSVAAVTRVRSPLGTH